MNQVYFQYCPVCGTAYDAALKTAHHRDCRQCGYTLYENQSATVGAVIRHQDKILLARRAIDPSKGKWDVPGGFVEPDETAEAAILREVKEETGLNVRVTKLLGLYGPTWYKFKGKGQYNTDIFFEVESDTLDCQPADDVDMCQWFSLDELPRDPAVYAFPSVARVIKEYYVAQ